MDKTGDVGDGNAVVAAAENGNATCLPGEPRRMLDDVSDRMLADAITCSRHGCMAAWSSISSKSCRKKGLSPTSVTGKADATSKAASFEFSPQIVWIKTATVADGNAVVPMERKENATFLLAKHETAWRQRMQSPACGTGARRRGDETSADRVQDEKKKHQRQ